VQPFSAKPHGSDLNTLDQTAQPSQTALRLSGLRQLSETTDPEGHATRYTWDPAGRISPIGWVFVIEWTRPSRGVRSATVASFED